MILLDTELLADNDVEGTLVYFGNGNNEEYTKWFQQEKALMAAFHDQLELLYETEYSWLWQEGHICHYHVNDYFGGFMDWENLRSLPIGKGKIDFDRFFAFLIRVGYDGFLTVEATAHNDEGVVDVELLNEQFRCIRAHLI